MKIILVRGIPASGKSTWARQWAEEDPEHRVRICRDDIRESLGKYWVVSREPLVREIKGSMIYHALDYGYDIVIDDMNLNPLDVKFVEKIVQSYPGTTIEFKDFLDVPLNECIKRDKDRGEKVGTLVLTSIFNRYENDYNLKRE